MGDFSRLDAIIETISNGRFGIEVAELLLCFVAQNYYEMCSARHEIENPFYGILKEPY